MSSIIRCKSDVFQKDRKFLKMLFTTVLSYLDWNIFQHLTTVLGLFLSGKLMNHFWKVKLKLEVVENVLFTKNIASDKRQHHLSSHYALSRQTYLEEVILNCFSEQNLLPMAKYHQEYIWDSVGIAGRTHHLPIVTNLKLLCYI